jgi:hypothetical protein
MGHFKKTRLMKILKNHYFIYLFILIIPQTVFSQTNLFLTSGIGISKPNLYLQKYDNAGNVESQNGYNPFYGLNFDTKLKGRFYLKYGVIYASNSIKNTMTVNYFKEEFSANYRINSFELPVSIDYKMKIGEIGLFTGFGGYFSYAVSGTKKLTYTNPSDNNEIEEKIVFDFTGSTLPDSWVSSSNLRYGFRRIDYGIVLLFEIEYKVFQLFTTYNYGVANTVYKRYEMPNDRVKNRILRIGLGLNLNCLKKKNKNAT